MPNRTFFRKDTTIYSQAHCLNTWDWVWEKANLPSDAVPVSALSALETLKETQRCRKLPVGVIGPREASEEQRGAAYEIGTQLGALGLTMICGGKSGVMEAASEGCLKAGGLTVGLIPDHSWQTANNFIALPIATGLSEARNMIIAKSCEVLIAVGGSYGTLTEIAYGLHFSKPVIGLCGTPDISGIIPAQDPGEAIALMADHLLARAKLS